MGKKTGANQREIVILGALLHGEKYGLQVADEVEKRTGRPIPLGSLYVTLDRMEAAGYIASRLGESASERGGNRRRYFKLTGEGLKAFNSALQAVGMPAAGKGVAHA